MNRTSSIVTYWLKSKKRHGVHSPFVFNLTNEVFREKVGEIDQKKLKKYANFLSNCTKIIEIEDFGAGSKKKTNQRKVNEMFRLSSSKKKYGRMLYQLAHKFEPKHILELGTNLAWGSYNLHLGYSQSTLYTVEGCKNTFSFVQQHYPDREKENWQHIHARFDDFIEQLDDSLCFDFIFIDGDHKGSSLLRYIEKLKKHSHNDTIWILDDIRWSDDMWEAWEQLTQEDEFHVSIDFFRMGMLVPRKQQEKEHFWIRG